jgi:hypothetical protein
VTVGASIFLGGAAPPEVCLGSRRVALPQEPPFTDGADGEQGFEPAAPDPGCRWRVLEGPFFDNQVATLRLDGRAASPRLDRTVPGKADAEGLRESFTREL